MASSKQEDAEGKVKEEEEEKIEAKKVESKSSSQIRVSATIGSMNLLLHSKKLGKIAFISVQG